MVFSYFTNAQLIPLVLSSVILIASIFTFQFSDRKIAICLLFLSSLGFGYFIANLDPFLMLWDEQYHALVSKHMIENPLKPTLYSSPLLNYDYRLWVSNHVWLHKQPLFLWQIALCLKIFGISEFSVRIPSIILHAIVTIMVYRIGKISYSSIVGFYGALFFSVAYYPLELVAGRYATDHNDVSFMFYICGTFWAWFEYQNSQKKYWLVLIGVFSGCAVLVKWLVGLLIYSVWFISIGVSNRANYLKWRLYIPILISFVISFVILIPWQLYILYQFPSEAQYEFQLNTNHFFEAVEGHSGNIWFHLKGIKDIYGSGDAVPFLILIGLLLFIKYSTTATYSIVILSTIIITYTFYTLASTKMTSFCIIVAPFGFLAFGTLIDTIVKYLQIKIKVRKIEMLFQPIALIFICFFLFDIPRIANHHTYWKPKDNYNRKAEMEQMIIIKKITEKLHGKNYVVFNANKRLNGHIAIMFYTDYIAYEFVPNEMQINSIKSQSYKIAIFNNDSLPLHIINDSDILKFK